MGDIPALSTSDNAVDQIKALFNEKDPYLFGGRDLDELKMEAIKERFRQRCQQIAVLNKLAKENGIDGISSRDDLVALLFSHETYKSYPEAFVRNNQWTLMNRWLDTLTVDSIADIDVSDVKDSEGWIARLAEHERYLVVSGGTSGKSSFLYRAAEDVEFAGRSIVQNVALTQGIEVDAKDRPVILLGPSQGSHVYVSLMKYLAESFGRSGEVYWLSDIPITEAYMQRLGELRRKIADGTATPGELQALKETTEERQEEMSKSISNLVDVLEKHRHEPVMIIGLWYPHFLLMEEAHRRGLGDGILHPESTVSSGGGTKGVKMPDDYKEQIARFYGVGPERYYGNYGMVEMLTGFMECEANRYHCPPWVEILILDKLGEKLAPVEGGQVEGRMAFFDIALEGRWGGVISGDKVTVDYNPCPCGRKSATVTDIMRYSDLPEGDDKLSCAGTMSSYIRGEIS